jgi:hypothetical protein
MEGFYFAGRLDMDHEDTQLCKIALNQAGVFLICFWAEKLILNKTGEGGSAGTKEAEQVNCRIDFKTLV